MVQNWWGGNLQKELEQRFMSLHHIKVMSNELYVYIYINETGWNIEIL